MFKRQGVRVVMLTGDNTPTAAVSTIDVRAELSSADKARIVTELKTLGRLRPSPPESSVSLPWSPPQALN
ncbi:MULTISPECIES: hypothetical protein [Streptomyces]|uniref:Cation-transporting P-type ATPase C-terminal domain-containing protein n=2 Tax=Streptomyces TaxID=1883 RepID=A0A1E7M0V1_9ACTN|nr:MULTISPECIES: hypothetical protein [Streptomyces]OEV22095.1 hypothetical protein AN221_04065 [Streptomyces nanshensis]ONI49497.1 hypothetical protein STIB_65870 [Streptomyces sp. IB2014 011-1]RDV51726.1 hypothetical protein DDV98_12015 [Streptomyces sp. IB2014 011-12]